MTTEDTTTPIHAFVRSDVVRSAFLAPLEASGWAIATLRDSSDLAALLRDTTFAVLVVDSAAAPAMPGPWVQGIFVGAGDAPDGLVARPFSTPVGQLAADLRRLAFVAQLAALRAARVHQARGFLEDVALRSALAALVGRKASGTIRFHSVRGEGCIYVREGRIIDVEAAGLRGEEALARLLAWTEATVHVAEGSVLGDALMTRATDDVFAEAERMAATVAAALVLLPKPGVLLELERFVAVSIVPRPSEDLENLLNLIDGTRDINALLDASPFDDASTARTLARFAQGGALRAAGTTANIEEVSPPSVALVARHAGVSLPQVMLEDDAPAPASDSGGAPSDTDGSTTAPIGATTPVGLFAAAAESPDAPGTHVLRDATPMAPGVEVNEVAATASSPRRTPISVETPAKAALDAAFRKAAQESQAALAANDGGTPTRRSTPPPVNGRALQLVGIIAAAAIALVAIVGIKGAASTTPAPKVEPVAAPAPSPAFVAPAAVAVAPPALVDIPAPADVEDAATEAAPVAPAVPATPPVAVTPAPVKPPAANGWGAHPAGGAALVPGVKLPPGHLQKAKDFLDQGNFVSATVEAQAVVQSDPAQAEAWLVLGASAQAQGKDADAKRFFGECVRRGRGAAVAECKQFAQ